MAPSGFLDLGLKPTSIKPAPTGRNLRRPMADATFEADDTHREEIMANRKAVIETNKGVITIELYEDKAPITAGNFSDLIQRGFYDGLTFHRYEPNFVIQGGDPLGNGTGGFTDPQTGRERRIKLEVSRELPHGEAGAVAM